VNARNVFLVGTSEWTFRGGDWSYRNTSSSAYVESTAAGTYVVDGDHIEFFAPVAGVQLRRKRRSADSGTHAGSYGAAPGGRLVRTAQDEVPMGE
jgi:hypothetical protein